MEAGRSFTGVALLLALLACDDAHSGELGGPPLCEASAATASPWTPGRVIVADNEHEETLFSFSATTSATSSATSSVTPDDPLGDRRPLPQPRKRRPRDIEALATVGDELLLVGSHSRNSSCRPKTKRRRLRLLRRSDEGLAETAATQIGDADWTTRTSDLEACLASFFTSPAPPAARSLCAALVAAEAATPARCRTLNIEGAAALPSPTGPRVWLGLRAPLIGGRAVLVRLAPGPLALRWDAVATIDLGGRGIRGLAVDGASLYGIAGPVVDEPADFALWSLPWQGLREVEPTATLGGALPESAEGILVADGRAVVVTDGARGASDEAPCRVPSGSGSIGLGGARDAP